MKRILVPFGAFVLSALLVGCGPDTNEGLISTAINLLNQASTEVGNIKARVKEAVEKAKSEKKQLNFKDAMLAAKKLKETGEEANKLNKRIERVRGQLSAADKKNNADSQRGSLNEAFKALLKQKQELRAQLAIAETLDPQLVPGDSKEAVRLLRDKIRDAESPFESLLK